MIGLVVPLLADVAVLGVFVALHFSTLRAHDRERHAWTVERGALVTRIQAPQFTPSLTGEEAPTAPGVTPTEPLDEWHLVGQDITRGGES